MWINTQQNQFLVYDCCTIEIQVLPRTFPVSKNPSQILSGFIENVDTLASENTQRKDLVLVKNNFI